MLEDFVKQVTGKDLSEDSYAEFIDWVYSLENFAGVSSSMVDNLDKIMSEEG